MSPPNTPASVLHERRILICVGTGGVGKTTVAAAMGLEAARRGSRVLVLTIDPARRLADALGLELLDNEPREVTGRVVGSDSGGRLFAMMLDTKSTFDGLIERFADSPQSRDLILQNPIYQHISGALSGSGEYAAMEKVLEMAELEDFDLIVVDTPPAQHALDFLDSPRRLVEFLDSRIVQLLVHPAMAAGRFGLKLFNRPIHAVLQLMEKVTGIGFLNDLSEFLVAIDDMSEGFKERAERIRTELMGPDSAFVLIAGPTREAVRNAGLFLEHLEEFDAPLSGVIINRMHAWPGGGSPPDALTSTEDLQEDEAMLARALAAEDGDLGESAQAAAHATVRATREYAARVRFDEQNVETLRRDAARRGCFFRAVPELAEDIHDLSGLGHVAAQVFSEPESAI